MSKAEDLTGKKYGKLTILRRTGTDKWGSTQWLCKCDCGKEIIRSRAYFFNKNWNYYPVKSCGCAYKHKIRKDLTGQKFGRWAVLRHDDRTDSLGRHFWLCRCDCGNEKVVGADFLIWGKSKSCGCLSDEIRPRKLALTGCSIPIGKAPKKEF